MGIISQNQSLAACLDAMLLFLTAPAAYAQVTVNQGATELRTEGDGNITASVIDYFYRRL